jgi:lipopolysaccharide biosynthesis regulator YciM
MEFDWQWLLIVPPLAFALGWIGSRIDLGQMRHSGPPRPYLIGLALLLNEQPDKAIDAFIEAVQRDPDTTELHFALGNLFRRRGEFERAVRVHQHLLQRGDLAAAERQRAQYALAHDFMKAGLFDRAEAAFIELDGTPFENEARLALLGLHERAHDWPAAAEVAAQLEKRGAGSFAARIAHYHCELAQGAQARGQAAEAVEELRRARAASPQSSRPLIEIAQHHARCGEPAQAFDMFVELRQRNPDAFLLVAGEFAAVALASGHVDSARETLTQLNERAPSMDLIRALKQLDGAGPALPPSPPLLDMLRLQPSLSAALAVLESPRESIGDAALQGVREALTLANRPLLRYRCAACGFETQRHFWQCPGCLGWDTYPGERVEAL